MRRCILLLPLLALAFSPAEPEPYDFPLAVLKYRGGGDWYANPTALPNLARYANQSLGTRLDPEFVAVEASSPRLFDYPFIHMTGHGNVLFDPEEVKNLQLYLAGGGFIHIDDNYGMDPYIRRELKKIFPDQEGQMLPLDHPLFRKPNPFPTGLPKIHEHDGESPEALAFSLDNRVVLIYTHESDLSDGWEDPEVHNDSPEVRENALKMGCNLLHFAFTRS